MQATHKYDSHEEIVKVNPAAE